MTLRRLRLLTAGESHGPGLSGILDGLPAGLRVSTAGVDARAGAPPAWLRQRPADAHRAGPGDVDGRPALRAHARLSPRLLDREPRLGRLAGAHGRSSRPRRRAVRSRSRWHGPVTPTSPGPSSTTPTTSATSSSAPRPARPRRGSRPARSAASSWRPATCASGRSSTSSARCVPSAAWRSRPSHVPPDWVERDRRDAEPAALPGPEAEARDDRAGRRGHRGRRLHRRLLRRRRRGHARGHRLQRRVGHAPRHRHRRGAHGHPGRQGRRDRAGLRRRGPARQRGP